MSPQTAFWLPVIGCALFACLFTAGVLIYFDQRHSPSGSDASRVRSRAIPRVSDGEPSLCDFSSDDVLLAMDEYGPHFAAQVRAMEARRRKQFSALVETRPDPHTHVKVVMFHPNYRRQS